MSLVQQSHLSTREVGNVLAVYLGVTMLSQHVFYSGVLLWREKEKWLFGDSEASLLKKSLKDHVIIRFAF